MQIHVHDNGVVALPQAREKQQLDSEMLVPKGESRNSMLMLVRQAESEVTKDESLVKPR